MLTENTPGGFRRNLQCNLESGFCGLGLGASPWVSEPNPGETGPDYLQPGRQPETLPEQPGKRVLPGNGREPQARAGGRAQAASSKSGAGLSLQQSPARPRLHLHPAPRGRRVGGRNFPARGLPCPRPAGTALSVYGEKGEMEKAGRRLASAAPPRGRFSRLESGARSAAVSPRPVPGLLPAARPRDSRALGSRRQATRRTHSPSSRRPRGTLR